MKLFSHKNLVSSKKVDQSGTLVNNSGVSMGGAWGTRTPLIFGPK